MGVALVATAAAFAGVLLGIFLKGASHSTRPMVPFAGGLLLGIALFGLLPELAQQLSLPLGLVLVAFGYGLLRIINGYLFPVCPSCAHGHDHEACAAALHGFAAPLLIAAAIHSTLDGWSIVTAQAAAHTGTRLALPLAMVLHKIPEGIALGAILRASVASRWQALFWSVLCESGTLLGGGAGIGLAPILGQAWIAYPLGIAAGTFVYLGFHAVHGEWKRRGAIPAFVPAITGAAGAAALQHGVEVFLR